MQISKNDSQNFGISVQRIINSTPKQKRFMNICLDQYKSPFLDLDSKLNIFGIGDILIKENQKGNTTVSVKLHNVWQDSVKELKEVFEVGKENFGVLREKLQDFIHNASFYTDVVAEHSRRSPGKIRELIKIAEDSYRL